MLCPVLLNSITISGGLVIWAIINVRHCIISSEDNGIAFAKKNQRHYFIFPTLFVMVQNK